MFFLTACPVPATRPPARLAVLLIGAPSAVAGGRPLVPRGRAAGGPGPRRPGRRRYLAGPPQTARLSSPARPLPPAADAPRVPLPGVRLRDGFAFRDGQRVFLERVGRDAARDRAERAGRVRPGLRQDDHRALGLRRRPGDGAGGPAGRVRPARQPARPVRRRRRAGPGVPLARPRRRELLRRRLGPRVPQEPRHRGRGHDLPVRERREGERRLGPVLPPVAGALRVRRGPPPGPRRDVGPGHRAVPPRRQHRLVGHAAPERQQVAVRRPGDDRRRGVRVLRRAARGRDARGARRGRDPETRRGARRGLHRRHGPHGHRRAGRDLAQPAARRPGGREGRRCVLGAAQAPVPRGLPGDAVGPGVRAVRREALGPRARDGADGRLVGLPRPPDAGHRDVERPRPVDPRVRAPPLPRRDVGADRPGRAGGRAPSPTGGVPRRPRRR